MLARIIEAILLLGAAQGLFLATVLAARRTNSTANRVLSIMMVTFALYMVTPLYYAHGIYHDLPHFIGVAIPLVFSFGPVPYVYAQTVMDGGHRLRPSAPLHAIPLLLVTLYLSPFFTSSGEAKVRFYETLARNGPPLDIAVIQQLMIAHGLLYVVLMIRLLRRHRVRLQETHSSVERVNLIWLRNLTVGAAGVWVVALTLNLLDLAGLGAELEASITPLALSVLVYAIGYQAMRQSEIFQVQVSRTAVTVSADQALASAPALPGPPSAPDDAAAAGYERSGLTDEQAGQLVEQLQRAMTERKLYRRGDLTLPELAADLAVSPHNLSEVLNTRLRKNFYDFVNGYRAEEVMRRLKDPASARLTILALAGEAGFNSKSSFNAFFRRYTGLTPSAYRAAQAQAAPALPT